MTAAPRLLLVPLLALGLQGCIAAVIPLAAAGAMGSAIRDNPETPQVETRMSAPVQPAKNDDGATAAPGAPDASPKATLVPLQALPAPTATDGEPGRKAASGERFSVLAGVTALPAPGQSVPALASAAFEAFADYALELAREDPLTGAARESALLAQPGVLAAERAPCRFGGNSVLVDLDPADGVFPGAQTPAPPGLAAQLARLRAAEIAVFWSTALTADKAGEVRQWLSRTGLDPAGDDEVLLLRYPDDRKQTRREEAGRSQCLIAMLGDERKDFDELFAYLRNPDAAVGLDAMLGRGWFLAPIPAEGPMQ